MATRDIDVARFNNAVNFGLAVDRFVNRESTRTMMANAIGAAQCFATMLGTVATGHSAPFVIFASVIIGFVVRAMTYWNYGTALEISNRGWRERPLLVLASFVVTLASAIFLFSADIAWTVYTFPFVCILNGTLSLRAGATVYEFGELFSAF